MAMGTMETLGEGKYRERDRHTYKKRGEGRERGKAQWGERRERMRKKRRQMKEEEETGKGHMEEIDFRCALGKKDFRS